MISRRFIVTAAHCIDGTQDFIFTQKNRNYAKLGCNRVSSNDCYTSSFDGYWIEPTYNAEAITNDVGLLRLESTWSSENSFPSTVGTICLASRSIPNQQVMTMGWGGMNAAGTQSQRLKEVS